MTQPNDPAFPFIDTGNPNGPIGLQVGLTKREYMATAFLAAIMVDPMSTEREKALTAISQADALIAGLSK